MFLIVISILLLSPLFQKLSKGQKIDRMIIQAANGNLDILICKIFIPEPTIAKLLLLLNYYYREYITHSVIFPFFRFRVT